MSNLINLSKCGPGPQGKVGLTLAKELQLLIGRIVKTLEADKQLPETVALKAAETVKNPFA